MKKYYVSFKFYIINDIANANKTVRIILRDDHEVHELMVENRKNKKNTYNEPNVFMGMKETQLSNIINTLLEELNKHDFSEIILVETTAAILNFVKRQNLIRFILHKNLSYLVNIVMENYDKPRVLAIQCLQLIGKVEEYRKVITQLGADDIL